MKTDQWKNCLKTFYQSICISVKCLQHFWQQLNFESTEQILMGCWMTWFFLHGIIYRFISLTPDSGKLSDGYGISQKYHLCGFHNKFKKKKKQFLKNHSLDCVKKCDILMVSVLRIIGLQCNEAFVHWYGTDIELLLAINFYCA